MAVSVLPDPAPIVEAVLFGLDGILADTASLHLCAWKQVLEEARDARAPLRAPDGETLAAMARREQDYYLNLLHARGTHAFASSIALVRALRRHGIATAVISTSQWCAQVLDAAGLTQLFDLQLDGAEAARLQLARKPDAAMFIDATRRLGIPPARAAIVEDSGDGVRAGVCGGFAVVIGVARRGLPHELELTRARATAVVADLAEVALESAGPGRGRLLTRALPSAPKAPSDEKRDEWRWSYDGIDLANEGTREALCTLGNGYFATRGAAAESVQDDVHYPGTYVAGCYNRLVTALGDQQMENESIVNLPNWLVLRLGIGDGDWLQPGSADTTLSSYTQEVDLSRGILSRQMSLTDGQLRRTLVSELRLVHMAQPHLAAQKFEITAANWSGELKVMAGLDANVANLNVRDDREFSSHHMVQTTAAALDSDTVSMSVHTSQSLIRIVEAARIRVTVQGRATNVERRVVDEPGFIGQELRFELREGETATIEKIVCLYTSRDPAISEPGEAARDAVHTAGTFDQLLGSHLAVWNRLWSRSHFEVGDTHANQTLRLHAFHVLQTLSHQTMDLDVGVPARALHGEGYRGHIFWDDVLVLPLLTYRLPELTKQLLGYRFRRLGAARRLAAENGCQGALFPWQSGSDGREETPTRIFNPRSRRWFTDRSRLQRHVTLAVAYEVWQYFEITNDLEFLVNVGAELLIEIARYFSSISVFNPERERYEIHGVMGPDEFHDGYPDADRPGVDNNAYTNIMVVWLMRRAIDTLSILRGYSSDELISTLGLDSAETDRWADITRRMFVPFHDGVISQFDGYERLKELDWEAYRARYGNIGRMDLILEAEGDTPNGYKLSKQADTLMLLYLLSAEELRELLAGLGYPLTAETVVRTVEYYLARSTHGSTLSQVIDAWVLARSDRRRSWSAFSEALKADAGAKASSSTAEGIHLGAMAGTLDIVQRCYTGLEAREGILWLNPQLPEELGFIDLNLLYRQQWLTLHVTDREVRITASPSPAEPIRIGLDGRIVQVCSGETHVIELPTPHGA